MAATNINDDDETDLIIPKGLLNPSQATIIKIPSRLYNTGPLVVVNSKHQYGLTNRTLARTQDSFTSNGNKASSQYNSQSRCSIRNGSELERLFTDYKPLTLKSPYHRSGYSNRPILSSVNEAICREIPSKSAHLNVTPLQVRASSGRTEIPRKISTLVARPISPKTIEITAGDTELKSSLSKIFSRDYFLSPSVSRKEINSRRLTNDPRYMFSDGMRYLSTNFPINFIKCPPDYSATPGHALKSLGCYKPDSIAEIRAKLYSPVTDKPLSRNDSVVLVKSVAGSLRIQPEHSSSRNVQLQKRKIHKKSPERYRYGDTMRYSTVPVRIVG